MSYVPSATDLRTKYKHDIKHAEKNSPRYYGVIDKNDSVASGARKILMSLLRIMGENRLGAIKGENPEHLHDIRVAARRFRSALKFFKPVITSAASRETENALLAISSQLGKARDSHVWMSFLEEAARNSACTADPLWKDYCEYQHKLLKNCQKDLVTALESDLFRQFWAKANHYLRIELPCIEKKKVNKESLCVHCARRLLKLNHKLLNREIHLADMSTEELHNFRKEFRKARYWAEFSAPVLGTLTQKYALRLKDLTDSIGNVHDIDVNMKLLLKREFFTLPIFEIILKEIRTARFRNAMQTWNNLNDKDFIRKLDESLRKLSRAEI